MLVVKGVEITSFSLVGELGGVDNVVARETLVSVVEVAVSVVGVQVVEGMHPGVVSFLSMFHVDKPIDVRRFVSESRSEDERFVR